MVLVTLKMGLVTLQRRPFFFFLLAEGMKGMGIGQIVP